MAVPLAATANNFERFVGQFVGEAVIVLEGETNPRDLSVTIGLTKKGFEVTWASVTYKANNVSKTKSYSIQFEPSQRANIYGSAMKTNMFGKSVPLDPLKGEPFVWARLEENTMSVFSLFITETGEYELQEYHRTLTENGMNVVFRRVINGVSEKEIRAVLNRVQ